MLYLELNGGVVGIDGPVISPGRDPGGDGKNEYQKTGDGKAFHDDLLGLRFIGSSRFSPLYIFFRITGTAGKKIYM
jgi:hypothetical protein